MAETADVQQKDEVLELQKQNEELQAQNEALQKIVTMMEAQLKAKAETVVEAKVIKVGKKKYRFAYQAKRKGVLLTEELLRQDEKLAAEVIAEGSGVLVEVA